MITRRTFIRIGALSLILSPVIGCTSDTKNPDLSWFLSEQELMRIGKAYATDLFTEIDSQTLLVMGWVLPLAEAECCKQHYLARA